MHVKQDSLKDDEVYHVWKVLFSVYRNSQNNLLYYGSNQIEQAQSRRMIFIGVRLCYVVKGKIMNRT